MCYCGLDSSIIIFASMRRSCPFLQAFCTQEGVWSLYIFFQNHNYQGGTSNFTYKASIYSKRLCTTGITFLADSQLYILLKPPSQLHSQLAILYHQNYLLRNSQLYILLKLLNDSFHYSYLQLVTQLVSYIAICDWICQNPPHMHTMAKNVFITNRQLYQ